jgi:TRAP-type C4-dicarboxylate transport system permease small subunit
MIVPNSLRVAYTIMDRTRKALIIAMFIFVVASGAIEIFLRYTPGFRSLEWTDEILRYLNIWIVFMAAGLAAQDSSHMALTYFFGLMFPPKILAVAQKIVLVIICLALLFIGVISAQKTMSAMNAVIQSMPLPIGLFYLAIPLGCLIMFFEYLLILIYGEHPFKKTAQEAV